MMAMKIGSIKQDYLLRFAKRVLTGDRANDVEDRQSIAAMTRLDEQQSVVAAIVSPPLDDNINDLYTYQVQTYISRLYPQFAAAFHHNAKCGSILKHEIITAIKQCQDDNTSYTAIPWIELVKELDVQEKVAEIIRLGNLREEIYTSGILAQEQNTLVTAETAIGQRISCREAAAMSKIRQVIEASIKRLRSLITSDPMNAVCLSEVDAHSIDLPELTKEHLMSPWLLSANQGVKTCLAKEKSPKLLSSISTLEGMTSFTARYQTCYDELRKRQELIWLEQQVSGIESDSSGWFTCAQQRLVSYKSSFASVSHDSIKDELAQLQEEDELAQKELLLPEELRLKNLELSYGESLTEIMNKEIVELIQVSFKDDRVKFFREYFFYCYRLVIIGITQAELLDDQKNQAEVSPEALFDAAEVIQLVESDTKDRCEAYTRNPSILAEEKMLHPILAEIKYYNGETPLDETKWAEKVVKALGARRGEGLLYTTWDFFDLEAALESLVAYPVESLRSKKEIILMYTLLNEAFAELRDKNIHSSHTPEFIAHIHHISEVIITRATRFARIQMLKSHLNLLEELYGASPLLLPLAGPVLKDDSSMDMKSCEPSDTISKNHRDSAESHDGSKLLDTSSTHSQGGGGGGDGKDWTNVFPSFHSQIQHSTALDENTLTMHAYDALAMELRWHISCYVYLHTNSDYIRLQCLERKLKLGISGDGVGGNLTLQEAIVDRIAAMKTERFSQPDVCSRIEGAVRLMSILGDSDDATLPWLNDFDFETAVIDRCYVMSFLKTSDRSKCLLYPYKGPYGISAREVEGDKNGEAQHDVEVDMFNQHVIREKGIDELFGAQRIQPFIGGNIHPRRTLAGKNGWSAEPTPIDESRCAKELYWSLLMNSKVIKKSKTDIIKFTRCSMIRVLEIAAWMFDNVTVTETDIGTTSVGFGGLSMTESFDLLQSNANKTCNMQSQLSEQETFEELSSYIKLACKQNFRWLGALSISLDRAGPFQLKQIAGNEVKHVTFASLSPSEAQYLLGLVFFTNSTVKFKIGRCSHAALLQQLNPWYKGDTYGYGKIDREGQVVGMAMAKGQELIELQLEVINFAEIAALPSDLRSKQLFHGNPITTANTTANTASTATTTTTTVTTTLAVTCLSNRKRYQEFIQKVDISTQLDAVDTMVSLVNVLEQFPNVTEIKMQQCKVNGQTMEPFSRALSGISKTLTRLIIGYNDIGDDGAIALATMLPSMSALKTIFIHHNQISTTGLTALCKGLLPCSTFEELLVKENLLDDAGAAVLVDFIKSVPSLTKLDAQQNKFSSAGRDSILDAWEDTGRRFGFNNPGV